MRDHLVSVATLVSTNLSGNVLRFLHPGREHDSLYRTLVGKLQRAEQGVGARHIFVFDRQYRSLLDTDGLMPIGREYPKLLFHRRELERVWKGYTAHSVLFYDGDVPVYDGLRPDFLRWRGRRGCRGRNRGRICGFHSYFRAVGADLCRVGCVAHRRSGMGVGADPDAAHPKAGRGRARNRPGQYGPRGGDRVRRRNRLFGRDYGGDAAQAGRPRRPTASHVRRRGPRDPQSAGQH